MADAIANKIKALLTKAERSDFPEEAEAFSAKAAELMAKHAIDEAQLMSDEDRAQIKVEHRRYVVGAPYSADRMYLVYYVSQALGGHAYFFKQPRDGSKTRTNSKDHNTYAAIVGTPSDIDQIEIMLDSLNKQMERARAAGARNLDGAGMGQKKVWNATFIRSYAQRIGQRLRESYSAEIDTATGGAALVLRDKKKLIEDELKKKGVRAERSSRQFSGGGAAAGRAAADSATLRTEVGR